LQRKKMVTTQRSIMAKPSSLFWVLHTVYDIQTWLQTFHLHSQKLVLKQSLVISTFFQDSQDSWHEYSRLTWTAWRKYFQVSHLRSWTQRFLGLTWTAGRKHFHVPPEELDANIFRFTWTAGRKYFQLHSCALGCSDFQNLGLFITGWIV
jgi:hypothetical protein